MACYPLILLVVGLKPQEIPHGLTDTVESLLQDCHNTPYSGLDNLISPRHHLAQASILPLHNDVDTSLENHPNFGITPIGILSNQIKDKQNPLAKGNLKNEAKANARKEQDDVTRIPLKEIQNLRNEEWIKNIHIPTVDDSASLMKSFKNRMPVIAISDRLLKRLTEYNDDWITKNPNIFDVYPGESKRPKYVGISTDYLAKLIAHKIRRIKKVGSKLLDPLGIMKKFKKVVHAALDHLDKLEKYERDDDTIIHDWSPRHT